MKKIMIVVLLIVGILFINIKDIVTNKDVDKMEAYSVYVSPNNIDIEFINGYGVCIGSEGINILPKI